MNPNLTNFIQKMPKAEIHLHLEGAIQPETLLSLARRHQSTDRLPSDTVDGLRQWFRFTDFPHFIEIYLVISDLLRTPDDFALAVTDLGRDLAQHNVRYAEVTFTPYTHTHLLDKGLTIKDLLAGIEAGRRRVKDEQGIHLRWVFDIPRNLSFDEQGRYRPEPADVTLAYALQGKEHGVIGFGLGGNEVGAPPAPFAHAFSAACAAGLASVPHAGETMGPESIWNALHGLQAQRIGHGVRAIEDPQLLTYLQTHRIPLEINPTSNIALHIYHSIDAHPLPHLHRMGLTVTVNTDDPPLFNTDLTREYQLLANNFGLSAADITTIARNAFRVSAAEPALRDQLLQEFDAWTTVNTLQENGTGATGRDH